MDYTAGRAIQIEHEVRNAFCWKRIDQTKKKTTHYSHTAWDLL